MTDAPQASWLDAASPPPSGESLLADVAIDCPGRDSYTYRVPDALAAELAPGDAVEVPFGPRRDRGYVLALRRGVPPPELAGKLKDVLRRLHVRLPPQVLELIRWGARYYRCSIGEFLGGVVPAAVREGREPERIRTVAAVPGWAGKTTPVQARALAVLATLGAPGDAACDLAEAARAARCTPGVFERLAAAGAVVIAARDAVTEVRLDARVERFPPTAEQQAAIDAVAAGGTTTWLLHGVTGSGKTLVYMELAERVIAAGKQALLLVPEIGLTPQLAARVRTRFPRLAIWHSGLSDGERTTAWREVAAGRIDLVLGTRSALFAPLPAPGLIIIDEEHEHSYKQEQVPRYHARDLAVVYARACGIPLVLGSATPSLESVHNVRLGKYQPLRLATRPAGAVLPTVEVVDMRVESRAQQRAAVLATALTARLSAARAAGEQGIVLLNRRGWAPVVSCRSCGHTLGCGSCAISLTWHQGAARLRCHYCGHEAPRPAQCPACGGALGSFGLGTEQLASLLTEAVPGLRVLRVDADTVATRQGHARLLQSFGAGEADCLVGTQMVAKGLDFPRVTVVGVLCADRGLTMPDFRAAERTWQLVAQVVGRAGRAGAPGTAVVQCFDPQAPAIRAALGTGTRAFIDGELAQRQEYGYPPAGGLVRFLWTGAEAARVQAVAEEHTAIVAATGVTLLGPNPAALERLKDEHRWSALLKAPSRGAAQAALDRAGDLPRRAGVHLAIDVDPYQIA